MDERTFILDLLQKYKGIDKDEENSRIEIIEFIKENKECFMNSFKLGHVTGSALIVDEEIKDTLLTHHTKLNKWFQLGGHSDGEWNTLDVAWREATEESGLTTFRYLPEYPGIFDVDVHTIPERAEMPEHKHYDIRILLAANRNEAYKVSSESHDLHWVALREAGMYNDQPSFLRLIKKAIELKK